MRNIEFGRDKERQETTPSGMSPQMTDSPETYLVPLINTLEEMIRLQQEMLSLLQREKKFMIQGELDDLLRCQQEKEALLGRLHHLEKRRQEETDLLVRQWGNNDRRLTLKQIIQRTPEPQRSRLGSCHQRLEALTASIQELNQINGLLVERILQQVTGLLGLLRHLSSAVPIYQPNGALEQLPSGGRIITQG